MTIGISRSALIAAALSSALMFAIASCSKDKPPTTMATMTSDTNGQGNAIVAIEPGVAGGVAQRTVTASTTITAIDSANRTITLHSPDGSDATFTAPPEMRNFDQLHVGDKVSATLLQKLEVFVDQSGRTPPSVTHAAALARAPKGAKPGATIAQAYEITGKISALDAANRTATIQFVGGESDTVNVRDDVDMSKYKVGDAVVIRVSEQLKLVAGSQ